MDKQNKLIITYIHNKYFLFLLNQNRMLSAFPFSLEQNSLLNQIYLGKVQKISQNIHAAFIEIQKGVFGFLPLKDAYSFYPALKAGDEIVVQVCREGVKEKLPLLTTKIQLAGSYCVLKRTEKTPALHASEKLNIESVRKIKEYLQDNGVTDSALTYDCIIRTKAGELSEFQQLFSEYQKLSEEFEEIIKKGNTRTCFSCLKGSLSWIQELQNIPVSDYDEIITDSPQIYEQILCSDWKNQQPIRLYQDENYPLHILYGINSKLECALNRRIWLKSGAYLIIDPTEAMTVIDVNTGKLEAKKQKSEAILAVNKEAATEIALQIRLRNLSGIILVDFINMDLQEQKKELLQFMRSLTAQDKIRTNVIDITPLGLMEITRKKVRKPLKDELGE